MCRKLVAAWMLAAALLMAVGSGARAAEPLAEQPVVEAVEAPAAPVANATSEASAAPEAEVSGPPWWLDVAEGALLSIFALISTVFFGYVGKKVRDNTVMKDALTALEAGVNAEWREVVRDLKHSVAETGGHLTTEQRRDAMESAIGRAKSFATGAAKRHLEVMGRELLESLVEKIIKRRKKTG